MLRRDARKGLDQNIESFLRGKTSDSDEQRPILCDTWRV